MDTPPNAVADADWHDVSLSGAATRSLPGGYRLWVSATGEGDEPLPLLWVLDGAAFFTSVARAATMLARRGDATGVRPMIVAGIDRDPPDRSRRDADYSFGPSRDPAGFTRPPQSAEGEAMLARIAGPAMEAVAGRHLVDTGRQALFGHSLAGLFALHALAARPELFRVVGAISPSIWWDRDAVRDRIDAMPDRGQALFLGAGAREEPGSVESDADRRRAARGIVREARSMAQAVAARLDEDRVALHIAPDEDHASAPLMLMPAFLRFASRALG